MSFKSIRNFTGAILALVSLGSVAPAATVANPNSGDIFIGFRTTGPDAYLINVGSDTVFRNAAPGSTQIIDGLGDIGADLTSIFGANWNTRADLYWGAFGVRSSANSIVYGSRERPSADTQSATWSTLDATARNATASQITSVLQLTGGYQGSESTGNSLVAVHQGKPGTGVTPPTGASSYYTQVATPGTNDFGSLSEWTRIEGDFGEGADGTWLDLYRFAGTGTTYVGYFSISDSGALSFTAPGVIPEPAVTLLFGAASALLLGRRRSSARP